MILQNDSSLKIYFGAAYDSCVQSSQKYDKDCFASMLGKMKLDRLVLLRQRHSVKGFLIDSTSLLPSKLSLFERDGDFIMTNQRGIGIGVLTADCLPVIFYDPVLHVLSVVHVGWRGAFSGILKIVINQMRKRFGPKPFNLMIGLGPSAKACCYTVSQGFTKPLYNRELEKKVIISREGRLFFDLPRFVTIQLEKLGIKSENINLRYNSCTICDSRFHSYRRDGDISGRQVTIAALE